MDAITLLKEDHKKVKELLNKVCETTERAAKTRKKLFSKIKEELKIHEAIEENLFYPLLKEYDKTRSIIFESYEEHALVDDVIAKIDGDDYASETWTAKFSVLKELVEHHVKEEEGTLFPKVRKIIEKDQLKNLGNRMLKMKEDYK